MYELEKFNLLMRLLNLFKMLLVIEALSLHLFMATAWAGPPFMTDDPEPVEYRYWEVYLASQYAHDKDAVSATAPLLEINYGAAPDLHLHMIVPFASSRLNEGTKQYGMGDIELGAKYRFIHESGRLPQVGTFAMVEVPSGSSSRGLGEGHARFFVPVWLQKSWGPWTTYGGGGYWFNPGKKNYWSGGWEVQRDISKMLTLGAELFYNSPTAEGENSRTGFNSGAIVNLNEENHILFSAGRDLHGQNTFSMYIAYQWTFGPEEKK